jgi:hypothetical protein
MQAHILIC